jgi:hypothetical protein
MVVTVDVAGTTWLVVGAGVTVVSFVTVVVFAGASTVAAGCVSDLVTVVVTVAVGAAVSGAGAVVGSDARSTEEYFACAGGWGFGWEHETRQAASKRETIVFIF